MKRDLLQTKDVARILDITRGRVDQLCKDKKHPLTVAWTAPDGTRYFAAAAINRVKQERIKALLAKVETLRST